jgi:hypothetical protein
LIGRHHADDAANLRRGGSIDLGQHRIADRRLADADEHHARQAHVTGEIGRAVNF